MIARRWWLGGGLLVAVVAIAGAGAWYFLLRDDAPPPVDLAAAVRSAQPTPSASGTASETSPPSQPASSATPLPPPADARAGRSPGELAGRWTLSDQGESFVGYRAQEELAGIGANTAVGRTSDITASLDYDGSSITHVEIEVDLTTLRSDDSRRDNQLRRQGLESDRFPTASFALTEPIAVGTPTEGVPIAAIASGDFTLHGVTRAVQIALEGELTNGLVVIVGSLDIQLSDYDIVAPTSFSVLSIEEQAVMEFQLIFE